MRDIICRFRRSFTWISTTAMKALWWPWRRARWLRRRLYTIGFWRVQERYLPQWTIQFFTKLNDVYGSRTWIYRSSFQGLSVWNSSLLACGPNLLTCSIILRLISCIVSSLHSACSNCRYEILLFFPSLGICWEFF